MTPHDLIAAFEDLVDAPDGVKRLRELVLHLAVRGKLVPQDPTDAPAPSFLNDVKARKASAASTQSRRHVGSIHDEAPWTVPPGWAWAEFGDTHINRDAERVPVSAELRESRKGPYDYYGASGAIDTIDEYLFDGPLLLIGEDGANLVLRSTPIAFIARGKYWVNNHAHVLDGVDEGSLRYLAIYVNSTDLRPFLTGMAQPKLNQARMNVIPCAVPPLAEQHRIVARVDELMGLLDRLEAARATRDQLRTAARDAALAALRDAEDHEAVEVAWARIAPQMDTLFTQPEDVAPLRMALSEVAVKGALTSSHGVGWRISSLADLLREPLANGRSVPDGTGFPVLRLTALRGKTVDTRHQKLGAWTPGEGSRFRIETGDLLVVRGNGSRDLVARASRVLRTEDVAFPDTAIRVRAKPEIIDTEFLHYAWHSAGVRQQLEDRARTTNGIWKVSQGDLEAVEVPIPPIAEQRRIVAQVDTLMVLCDNLEARLTATSDLHAQFAAAAVHHLDV